MTAKRPRLSALGGAQVPVEIKGFQRGPAPRPSGGGPFRWFFMSPWEPNPSFSPRGAGGVASPPDLKRETKRLPASGSPWPAAGGSSRVWRRPRAKPASEPHRPGKTPTTRTLLTAVGGGLLDPLVRTRPAGAPSKRRWWLGARRRIRRKIKQPTSNFVPAHTDPCFFHQKKTRNLRRLVEFRGTFYRPLSDAKSPRPSNEARRSPPSPPAGRLIFQSSAAMIRPFFFCVWDCPPFAARCRPRVEKVGDLCPIHIKCVFFAPSPSGGRGSGLFFRKNNH